MTPKNLEKIRVLFTEAWGSKREVIWQMQWRGSQLYLFNKRTMTKILDAGTAKVFLDGLTDLPHGAGRRVKFIGRVAE